MFPEGTVDATPTRRGATIRLFLADGSPEGLWIVEKSNWTGVALTASRAGYQRLRARGELDRVGVYVLNGPSEVAPDVPRVYVGEADILRKRLDQHQANKDFWTRVVVFTTKDASLNKAHARYLEARLLALANEAQRVELDNGNAPHLPALSEAETADMEAFLDEMLVIYPVLDIMAFEKAEASLVDPGPALFLSGPDAEGRGREAPDGFIVMAGSIARKETVPSIHSYLLGLRGRLLQEGVLQETSAGLRFVQDHAFNSPSTAAGVVLGRAANGRTEWKDADGRTLKEIQAEAVAAPATLEAPSSTGGMLEPPA